MKTNIQLPMLPGTSDYSQSNSIVQEWTGFFRNLTAEQRIFELISETSSSNEDRALVVGSYWSEFSRIVPNLLIQAAAKLKDINKQLYFVRIAHEELGGGNLDEVHADLFNTSLRLAGVSDQQRDFFVHAKVKRQSLDIIERAIVSAKSDSEIIGIGLGLEAPAFENIEILFSSLLPACKGNASLEQQPFFKIHRVVETEHIRLNIENFLRYCHSATERQEFLNGFYSALQFWKIFWDDAAKSLAFQSRASVRESCG